MVRRLMQRAERRATVKGAHVLRHTAATEMLRHGVPLEKIGLVLRHRGVDTTARYARPCRAPEANRAALAGGPLMLNAIEAYLALRRATGFVMLNADACSGALPRLRLSAGKRTSMRKPQLNGRRAGRPPRSAIPG